VTGTRPLFSGFYPATSPNYAFVSFNGTGIYVNGHATIGGSAAGAGNVIAGLLSTYLALDAAGGSVVEGNIIGLDVTGTKSLYQYGDSDGIDVSDNYGSSTDPGVTIGGPLPVRGTSSPGPVSASTSRPTTTPCRAIILAQISPA